jgi:hypothetical protein
MIFNGTLIEHGDNWLHFDVHGRLGIRVDANAPTAAQLRTMLGCFITDEPVAADIAITGPTEPMLEAGNLEHELSYSDTGILFHDHGVQVIRDRGSYRIHGTGELLTALVPILDRAMVEREVAMFHAATVAYKGLGIAMPAAGGTGKTSTIAKLMRHAGFGFMGDDWAFLSADGDQLGFAKPMFIKPHHRPIYPHLFEGARKPLVPKSLSRPIGRMTTIVHPAVVRYPRLADVLRRWSPEHRMVSPSQALSGSEIVESAPLAMAVFVERYEGARTRLEDRTTSWMVDRMIGNFHIEMAGFSQHVVAALGASSVLSLRQFFEDKADVMARALDGRPCYVLRVPRVLSADQASDDIVGYLDMLVEELGPTRAVVGTGR